MPGVTRCGVRAHDSGARNVVQLMLIVVRHVWTRGRTTGSERSILTSSAVGRSGVDGISFCPCWQVGC